MATGIGWDGCASCFGCQLCTEAEGDCCVDCTHDGEFKQTKQHDCPTCSCDGGTAGISYSNRICNCKGHTCWVSRPTITHSDAARITMKEVGY